MKSRLLLVESLCLAVVVNAHGARAADPPPKAPPSATPTRPAKNQPPQAEPMAAAVAEDAELALALAARDPDGDPLHFQITKPPTRGRATVAEATGALRYVPNKDFFGPDALVVRVRDGRGGGVDLPVTITVSPQNDAPALQPARLQADEDKAGSVTLKATDIDGDALTFRVLTQGALGKSEIDAQTGTLTFMPSANANGADAVVVEVSDKTATAKARVEVSIRAVNDAPVLTAAASKTNEDTAVTVDVLASDIEKDALAFSVKKGPAHGAAAIDGKSGRLTYTPAANFFGEDGVEVEVRDAAGGRAQARVAVVVAAQNDAPAASPLNLSTDEDRAVTGKVMAADVDGDVLSFAIGAPAKAGTATVDAKSGTVTYTPRADANGTDAFSVRVSDGTAAVEAAVQVTVKPVNDAPVLAAAAGQCNEDTTATIDVSAVDAEKGALTYRLVAGPGHGNASVDPKTGRISYTPAANYAGADGVEVEARDPSGARGAQKFGLVVAPVNDAPTLSPLKLSTDEDHAVTGALAAADIDGDVLSFSISAQPKAGTATVDAKTGAVSYTPAADANGTDTFIVTVSDAKATADARVDVAVKAINDAPVLKDGALSTDEDTKADATFAATDAERDALTWRVASGPAHGSATVDPSSGRLAYTPAANFHGDDQLTLEVADPSRLRATAAVRVQVKPVNDAPAVGPVAVAADEDSVASGKVTASDVDGDVLTFSVAAQGKGGTATIDAKSGAFVYTPKPNLAMNDTVTVRVTDGTAAVDAKVDVTIRAVNDAPVATGASPGTPEDTELVVNVDASDVENEPLRYRVGSGPKNGVATIDASSGRLSYVPTRDFNGSDAVEVVVRDPAGAEGRATLQITVSAVNDAPLLKVPDVSTSEDTAARVTAAASDVDGDVLSFSITQAPAHAAATIDSKTGALQVTPAQDVFGPDRLEVTVTDGKATTAAAVRIDVRSVNDAPVTHAVTVAVNEDGKAEAALGATDVDNEPLRYRLTGMPKRGAATVNEATGAATYLPAHDQNGDDTFRYQVTDPHGATSSGDVTVAVTPVNDAPTLKVAAVATEEDRSVSGTAVGNDIDKDKLTFSVAEQGSHGRTTVDASTGAFVYSPNADENGGDQVVLEVSDGVAQARATLAISIAARPDAPRVDEVNVAVDEDAETTFTLGCRDPDGEKLTIRQTSLAALGVATLVDAAAGRVQYRPNPNANGKDGITWDCSDGGTPVASRAVIDVRAVNDAPVANGASATTQEDTAVVVELTASDIDQDPVTFAFIDVPAAGRAGIELLPKGRVRITPPHDAAGVLHYAFVADDGHARSAPADLAITIAATNDAPVARTGSYEAKEDMPIDGTCGGTDVDSPALTYKVVQPPTRGDVVLNASTGTFHYTPRSNVFGDDSFLFVVSDGELSSAKTRVGIKLLPVDDAPRGIPGSILLRPASVLSGKLEGYDPEGAALTFRVGRQPVNGTVTITNPQTGAYTYKALASARGEDAFTFVVSAGGLDSDETVIAVTVK